MSEPTVGRWRQRLIENGIDGLLDEPSPGTAGKAGDAQVEEVVTRTLESTPWGGPHGARARSQKRPVSVR
jgi:transposase